MTYPVILNSTTHSTNTYHTLNVAVDVIDVPTMERPNDSDEVTAALTGVQRCASLSPVYDTQAVPWS